MDNLARWFKNKFNVVKQCLKSMRVSQMSIHLGLPTLIRKPVRDRWEFFRYVNSTFWCLHLLIQRPQFGVWPWKEGYDLCHIFASFCVNIMRWIMSVLLRTPLSWTGEVVDALDLAIGKLWNWKWGMIKKYPLNGGSKSYKGCQIKWQEEWCLELNLVEETKPSLGRIAYTWSPITSQSWWKPDDWNTMKSRRKYSIIDIQKVPKSLGFDSKLSFDNGKKNLKTLTQRNKPDHLVEHKDHESVCTKEWC